MAYLEQEKQSLRDKKVIMDNHKDSSNNRELLKQKEKSAKIQFSEKLTETHPEKQEDIIKESKKPHKKDRDISTSINENRETHVKIEEKRHPMITERKGTPKESARKETKATNKKTETPLYPNEHLLKDGKSKKSEVKKEDVSVKKQIENKSVTDGSKAYKEVKEKQKTEKWSTLKPEEKILNTTNLRYKEGGDRKQKQKDTPEHKKRDSISLKPDGVDKEPPLVDITDERPFNKPIFTCNDCQKTLSLCTCYQLPFPQFLEPCKKRQQPYLTDIMLVEFTSSAKGLKSKRSKKCQTEGELNPKKILN